METLICNFSESIFHPFEKQRKSNMVDSSTQTDFPSFSHEAEYAMALISVTELLADQERILL